jgi:Domain of unknown function (DUF4288)
MWYCACILKVAERNGHRDADPLWEEQFLLIKGEDEEGAKREARNLVHDEAPYANKNGDLISWKFERIDRIYPISDKQLRNGTEIFSRFLRDSEVKSLTTPFAETER